MSVIDDLIKMNKKANEALDKLELPRTIENKNWVIDVALSGQEYVTTPPPNVREGDDRWPKQPT